ncbi:uncharacterized protein HVO_B0252 (plasmid) [Haloferax volcanii DS2]|uniref:Uncharacterized protein n=1 Tax=Haloferax volcanii (strain ATCC 29605 / DSM 3757 / JCM 8879 / NBRC 14742 / NCIMB 2012 / VKM B-1768 / DS2) TaxID=309800 RepID=D4GPQ0_HALVD|nr:uncharacterized protein HVO_B0252 [Haloferax volcanii DS2]
MTGDDVPDRPCQSPETLSSNWSMGVGTPARLNARGGR